MKINKPQYARFECQVDEKKPLTAGQISGINVWRNILYDRGLIGVRANGEGFGSLSTRISEQGLPKFIITGAKTRDIERLNERHYTLIEEVDIDRNFVRCSGQIAAPSDSIIHATIYLQDPRIKAIMQVYNLELGDHLKRVMPATSESAKYGSPEMAREIGRLFAMEAAKLQKIFVIGGHKGEIFTFGETLSKAGGVLLKFADS